MNPVLYWNYVLLEASRRDFTRGFFNGQQPGPIRTSYAMAIVHIAIHDAIAFRTNPAAAYINKKLFPHTIPVLTGQTSDIIAGAAVTTLKALYRDYGALFDDALGQVHQPSFNEGVMVGQAVLDQRAGDGSDQMLTGPQVQMPAYGQHRADPFDPRQPQLGPKWGLVRRFSGSAHKPLDAPPGTAPNFLADASYRADYEEVRDLGAAARGARTAEQERIAVYWGYDGANNLGVPPRLYNQVTRAVVRNRGLSRDQLAQLFAAVNIAMADAAIDAWHYKYKYNLWRPVVGIRAEAVPDLDCFWAPLGMPQTNAARGTLTPPFPAYPSGHATFGAAVMQALRLGLGTAPAMTVPEVMDFEDTFGTAVSGEEFEFVSDELDGIAGDPGGGVRARMVKTFKSFAEPVWENSVSRIYLGVHWRFDGLPRDAAKNIGGVPLGLAIGTEAHEVFADGVSLAGAVGPQQPEANPLQPLVVTAE